MLSPIATPVASSLGVEEASVGALTSVKLAVLLDWVVEAALPAVS